MTLVYHRQSGEPQTHALICGVGHFPFLKGQNPDLPETFRSVKDVTSPPNNARAICQWMIDHADDIHPKLGSIELVISEDGGAPAKFPLGPQTPTDRTNTSVSPATGTNVFNALQSWLVRCEVDERNVGWFYGSSHGMEAQEHVLLLEDAGHHAAEAYRNTLSLDHLHRNLYKKAHKKSVLFADCCADLLAEATYSLDKVVGQTIGTITPAELVRARNDVERLVYRLRASPYGVTVKATQHGLGFFTEALLKCLDGAGAILDPQFGWCISPETLRRAVRFAGRYGFNRSDKDMNPVDEDGHWDAAPIVTLKGPPDYPVRVREADEIHRGQADLLLENAASSFRQDRPATFNSNSALCTWVKPDMTPYRASGVVNIGGGANAIVLTEKSFSVVTSGADIALEPA